MFKPLVLLAALVPAAAAATSANLQLMRDRASYPVTSAQVMTDSSRVLTIEQVRARESSGKVAWQTTTRFNFGYSAARHWIKLKVANQDAASDWMVELGYPLIQGVELHEFVDGKEVAGFKTGRLLPFNSRPIAYHNFLFPVSIPKGKTAEIYVMAESNGTVFVPLSLSTKDAPLAKSIRKTTAIGLYGGVILAMVLYNLFLLFAVRDRNYLFYIGYAATFCLLMMSLNGISYQYLWPDWPTWNKVSVPVLVGVSYLFLALFTKSFLETRTLAPRLNLAVNAVIAGAVYLILGGFLHYGLFVNRFTSLFIAAAPFVLLPISALCLRRGSPVAIYYLLAFGCFFLGSGTHALRDMGWLPQNFATENGPYLGSAAEMLLLSLGLAARIKLLKDRLAKQSAVSAFASQVAHDIRSPLAALDVLEKDLSKLPEGKRVLLRGAVARIRDIANSLLAKEQEVRAAAGESGPTPAADERSSLELLSGLVDGILSEKRLQYRAKSGVTIEADFSGAYGLFASVPPSAFKRDLSNLINNAVEAAGEKGRVVVSLAERDGDALLTVADDGAGIPAEVLSRLGQRGVTHGKAGGQGLGIYRAKADAEAWGGSLDIRSESGKGTSVALRLPCARPPSWFVPALAVSPGATVVVLDDDASIHQVWDDRFDAPRATGGQADVRHLFNARELRSWVTSHPERARAALYLVDYELIGESETGLDLIEELSLVDRAILVTSRAEERGLIERCARLGVRLIPKGLAGSVPLKPTEEPKAPDAVLVDDDQLVHVTWQLAAEGQGRRLATYHSPERLLATVGTLPKETPIYLDSDLGNGVEGTRVARDLHDLGFRELYLATGRDRSALPRAPWIKRVVGKEPPWS